MNFLKTGSFSLKVQAQTNNDVEGAKGKLNKFFSISIFAKLILGMKKLIKTIKTDCSFYFRNWKIVWCTSVISKSAGLLGKRIFSSFINNGNELFWGRLGLFRAPTKRITIDKTNKTERRSCFKLATIEYLLFRARYDRGMETKVAIVSFTLVLL